jgi:peptidoglycan/LPS O-acetylase OafA/YrhL
MAGMLMAEMTLDPDVQAYAERRPYLAGLLSTISILLGLIAISYPEENPEWAAWSSAMQRAGNYLFPAQAEYSRFYPSIGGELICLGVMFNQTAKRMLSSSPLCYLGKVSFAISLIHAPLVRTVLTYMLFGLSTRPPSPGVNEQGNPLPQPWVPMTSKWVAILCIPLFYYVLYRIANLWVKYVEPWCGKVTDWIEQRVFREESRAEKQLLA